MIIDFITATVVVFGLIVAPTWVFCEIIKRNDQ
jgi:hypothetical protein